MKLIFTILFFWALSANATNYYVSTSGDDGATGLIGHSWKYLSRINSFSFSDGDSILLNRGDVWNEQLIVPHANINFGAYGAGVYPEITGLYTPTGYTDSSHVWSTTLVGGVNNLNTVVVDGVLTGKGKTTSTQIVTGGAYGYLVNSFHFAATDRVGQELVVATKAWILDVVKVTRQTTDTLFFNPNLTYNNGGLFFYQNAKIDLNIVNEWCINTDTKEFSIYKTSTPTGVQVSNIDTLVYAYNKPGISFSNILFTGSNQNALLIDSCIGFKIANCKGNNNGAKFLSYSRSDSFQVINDSVTNTWSNALYEIVPATSNSKSGIVQGNYIVNTGTVSGMGESGNQKYIGVWLYGDSVKIKENQIINTGYSAMYFTGTKDSIKNNYINSYCNVKADGGGIYTFKYQTSSKNYIGYNIVRSGSALLQPNTYTSPGIYLDNNTKDVVVEGNTTENTNSSGIFLHQVDSVILRNNTFIDSIGIPVYSDQYTVTNSNIKGNIVYSQLSTQPVFKSYTISSTTVCDSNYYLRPLLQTSLLKVLSTSYDLPAWTTVTTWDAHSSLTPANVTSTLPLILYNTTLNAATTSLTGAYTDGKGILYNNSITLQPFASAILFKSTNEIATPSQIFNYGFKLIQK